MPKGIVPRRMFGKALFFDPPCNGCSSFEECKDEVMSCNSFSAFLENGYSSTPLYPRPSRKAYIRQFRGSIEPDPFLESGSIAANSSIYTVFDKRIAP